MKKILVLLISLAMLGLCACGGQGTETPATSAELGSTEAVAESESTESVNDSKLYEDFLSGNAKLYGEKFENSYWDGDKYSALLESPEGYTLVEFVNLLHSMAYNSSEVLTEINSSLIDCGNDGVPELAVEIVFSDAYDSILTREAVIKEIDGKLELCHITETYYRYYERLSKNGLIVSGGSDGAMSFGEGYGVIDADGQYHTVYYEEGEYALCSYYPEFSDVAAAASKYTDDINDEWLLRTITLYDENDAEEIVYGADPEDEALVIQIFDEAGVKLTSAEEIDKLLSERLAVYGVTAEEEYINWDAVNLDSIGLAEVVKYGFNPIHVSNVSELVDAIDDNVTIILAPGTYNLTEWLKEHESAVEYYCEQTADSIKGVCNAVYEDYEFGIANITGMTIVSADENNPAEIVSEPRYCDVINFLSSSSNQLKNLKMGHMPLIGTCSGDVVAFNYSYDNRIIGCDLYGCGAYGIYAYASSGIDCENAVIHDCSYGLVEAYNGSYLNFDNCEFKNCEGYCMVDLSTSDAYFNNCSFSNLKPNMLWMDESSYATFCSCMFDYDCAESVNSYVGDGTVNIY